MKKKTKSKKFVSYKKLKKAKAPDVSNSQQTTFAVALSTLRRLVPKGPLVLLSLSEMERGELEQSDVLEKKPIMDCWKYLIKTFPNVFSIEDPKPLKIGIHFHICRNNAKISMEAVCCVLASYTGTTRYREALCTHSVRIGLDGNPAGLVSAEQLESVQRSLNPESAADKVA